MIVIIPLVIAVCILAWILRPGRDITMPRKAGIMGVVIPSLVVAIAAITFQLVQNSGREISVSDTSNALFIVGLGVIVAAILASVGYVMFRKTEIARGIGFGTCVAVVVSVLELGLLEWLGGV